MGGEGERAALFMRAVCPERLYKECLCKQREGKSESDVLRESIFQFSVRACTSL